MTSSFVHAPLVRSFSEISDADRVLVGGKAHGLGTLRAAGFEVPDGFALTTGALVGLLDQPAVAEALAAVDAELAHGRVPSESTLRAMREQVVGAAFSPELRAEVGAALRRHFDPLEPLAVRSSGSKEDLEGASFAGQYETFLNIRGEIAVELAIKRCWSSIWQERVLTYAASKAGGSRNLMMWVIVQRLVPADVSGVLFTVNPVTGRERESVIEAAFGLGESLVSGRVTGDRFVVDPTTGQVRERVIAEKRLMIVADAKTTTREVELEGEAARAPTLDDARLAELAELGAAIQEHYGRPMDVEWAIAGGKLHVLQARPITRISFSADLGEWTTADFRDGGVSSDVCSTFMWSLYELSFDSSMSRYFKDIRLLPRRDETKFTQMFFARPYWNLGAVKGVLESIPGFNERNFDTDLGISPTYSGPGRTTAFSLGGLARALPVLFSLKKSYKDVLEHDRRFTASFDERKAPFDVNRASLEALDRATFARRYRELVLGFYFDTETSYFTTIYNTSNSKLDFKVHFEKANAACGGTLNYLSLMSGLKDLSHLRPVRELHGIAGRLRREGRPLDDDTVRAYAERWRHHSERELDIRVPRWNEDLPFVRRTMEEAIASHDPSRDPDEQVRRQHEAYLAERQKARRALRFQPLALRSFEGMLNLVRQYAWWREEMRDRSSFAYYLVRLWSTEAGRRLTLEGRLNRADDIWYLRCQDALALVEGTLGADEAKARARANLRMVRSFRSFQNPNEIGTQYRVEAKAAPAPGADALRGTGCSPGRVVGRARVVSRLSDTHVVQAGEILVTPFTDPGWTPLFARIAGVVTETGGVLAHAAVIAREYGIPAVLAVPSATKLIGDGDLIAIEGTQGTVEVVERAPRTREQPRSPSRAGPPRLELVGA